MIIFMLVLMVAVMFSPNPMTAFDEQNLSSSGKEVYSVPQTSGWLKNTIVNPFAEFFGRTGFKLGLGILLFLFSFRLGEAMLGRMSLVFYVELGFTTEQIAFYQKFFGGLLTIIFSLIGAFINTRFGIIRGMLVGGIAMASSKPAFLRLWHRLDLSHGSSC